MSILAVLANKKQQRIDWVEDRERYAKSRWLDTTLGMHIASPSRFAGFNRVYPPDLYTSGIDPIEEKKEKPNNNLLLINKNITNVRRSKV